MLYSFLVCFVISIIIGGFIYMKKRSTDGLIFSLVIGVVSSMGMSLILGTVFATPYSCKITHEQTTELYSGYTSNNTIRGSFFLLAGSIGTEDRVMYWYKTSDNLIHKSSVLTSLSAFSEEEGREDGKLVAKTFKCKADSILGNDPIMMYNTYYYFYVPKGSIVTGFDIK